MKIAPNNIYDHFTSTISSYKPKTPFCYASIAPQLDARLVKQVTKSFSLSPDERILYIRNYATKDGDFDLVFTERAIYHNHGGHFSVAWKDLSCVLLQDYGLCFYRGYRCVLHWETTSFPDGVQNVDNKAFINLLNNLASYAPEPVLMAKTVADTFCRSMSKMKHYYENDNDRLGVINPNKPSEYDTFPFKQTLPTWGIPDRERIILFRVSDFWNDKPSFIVTDSAIYLSPNLSFKWHSLNRVTRIGDIICFFDQKGACHRVPMYDIIKCKKGFLRNSEEEVNVAGTTIVNAFNNVIKALKDAKVPSLNSFTKSYENHTPASFISVSEEVNRCPYCGSRSFHFNADYERRNKEAQRKHNLEQVGGAILTYLIKKQPSGYSAPSRLLPIIFDCDKCGKTWKSDHE